MKTPALFKEYIWLVNTIHSAKRISFADINEQIILVPQRFSNTPSPKQLSQVAGGKPFQSP